MASTEIFGEKSRAAAETGSGHGSGHGINVDEKFNPETIIGHDMPTEAFVENKLNVAEDDLNEAKERANQMSTEEVRTLMTNVFLMHENDPNFPHLALLKIKDFLSNEAIFVQPEKYEDIIYEMKVEAALITNNSPYSEVRAVVSNKDDPTLPSSTVRAWVIGLGFSVLLAFINQLFSIRQPSITVMANVAQLLAYPVGKLWEKTVPDWGFHLPAAIFGAEIGATRISLNPGPFNKKEHMLVTIMANVAWNTPYTDNIIWTQYLPTYFNQKYAGTFSYQILVALSTNLIGYGLAGLCRRFLVYPAYCVWPTSLVTIALNEALHSEKEGPVVGPFKTVWRASRMKFFIISFAAMFVYFWFPNYIFTALASFSWITWIAPNNIDLSAVSGSVNGMGFNPWPTFDWNTVSFKYDPLVVPFFTTINIVVGATIAALAVLACWYQNGYHTGYLPINSNRLFDNTGARYNISRIIDERAIFDQEKYNAYSPAYMAAGNMMIYVFFFAIYPATMVYIGLNHRYEFMMGMRNSYHDIKNLLKKLAFWRKKDENETQGGSRKGQTYEDVHNRLMARYPEVSELWYMAVLLIAIAFGVAGISNWQTYTTPGVVFYGIALCMVFVLPIGIVFAMTGAEVTLNVLAEFIGGAWSEGNALAMNYFKAYGYVTCAQALRFSKDLKLAHYLKVPPRHTFWAQTIATIVSTFVCTGVLNFQMNQIPNVCTTEAANRFTCPGINTFFTAAVLWGTIGPRRIFGADGQYTAMLVGFPIGVIVSVVFWYAQRVAKKRAEARGRDGSGQESLMLRFVRQAHPVAFLYGPLNLSPYNLTYLWPTAPIAFISWIWIKNRWLSFWSRYNFVLSASFSSGVAIAGIIIFFAVQYTEVEVNWWGNNVVSQGCEDSACPRLTLADGDFFGPGIGHFN